jgi:hypothetical protein
MYTTKPNVGSLFIVLYYSRVGSGSGSAEKISKNQTPNKRKY